MLTAFSVKNFKSIRDSGKICIKPLTIFIGPNSSGKSSLLQFLLVLKQTVEATNTKSPFVTRRKEGYVDIGGYEDFIFLHEKERLLSFKLYYEIYFEIDSILDQNTPTIFPLGKTQKEKTKLKKNVETESVIRYKQEEIYLDTFIAKINGKTIKLNSKGKFEQDFIDERLLSEILEEFWRTIESRPLFRKEKFYYVPGIPITNLAFTVVGRYSEKRLSKNIRKELIEHLGIIEVLNDFQTENFNSFTNLFYLGPLREHPQRYYFDSGEKPIHVGIRGERAAEVLHVTNRMSSEVFQRVNSWFKKLGFGEVSFKPLTESIYALKVTHPTIKKDSQDLDVNIAAVGFGASQLLPVVVEGFYAQENAIIIIEQPEIHLHPRLQAEMGDLLMDIAKTGKRLIVETHSEHLLLRIQRRIAEGTIAVEDVVVYYFEQTEKGTRITKLELDKFGRFTNWPKGFFEEDLMEAYEHSKAIAKKIDEGVA